jgi:hypothetical protein
MADYPPPETRTRHLTETETGWLLDGVEISEKQALQVFERGATPLIIRPLSPNCQLRPRPGDLIVDELAEKASI